MNSVGQVARFFFLPDEHGPLRTPIFERRHPHDQSPTTGLIDADLAQAVAKRRAHAVMVTECLERLENRGRAVTERAVRGDRSSQCLEALAYQMREFYQAPRSAS